MEYIQKIHNSILDTICKKGSLEGIVEYEKNKAAYRLLNPEESLKYFKQIKDAIEKKQGFTPISILSKDDPFLDMDIDSLSDEEIGSIRRYRQNIALTPDSMDYIMEAYKRSIELMARTDWVPVFDMLSKTSYWMTSDSPRPEHRLITLN